jgi:nanoRNase/pAp phosphatase (c-di-AMP/oligoRNAs hydrolase)
MGRLEKVLENAGPVLVVSHNNPDPDSIVSVLLLKAILSDAFRVPVITGYSGIIGRAENRALLEHAGLELIPLRRVDRGDYRTLALVDAQPGTGNHPFDDGAGHMIVFDHHELRPATRRAAFWDVREHFGTTTTLIFLYHRACKLLLTREQATAMLYALRSETSDMGRAASPTDLRLFKDLYAHADLTALSKIVHAKVDEEYFSAIHTALERSTIQGSLVITRMGGLPYPDVAAQIAEDLLRYRGVSTTFAIGVYGGEILFSLRSDDPGANLGRLAHRIADGLGSAGGHGASAGGQIPLPSTGGAELAKSIEDKVVERLLRELGFSREPARRLISPAFGDP